MSDEHGRPAGPVPGADEPTRPVQNGVTPDHNRPAGGPPEPGRPGNATPEPNRPAGATPEPGRSAGLTPDHGRSAGVTPPPIPPRPLPPTAPVDGPVSERTTQIIPPRPDAVSEQATDRVEAQRREPAAPPRPAEAARPEPPRPEQQRPEPPRAPEQHERPTLSKPEPPTTVQAPPWQRGPAGQVPQREPQSNLHRPGEPPVTGRPPAAPARDSDEAERAARREAAKVKSAVIDGPTRSIARPELAKDMPDLSEVRHPTPSSEPARAHAVPVAAAVPPPAADGAGLRATVQLRRIDPWSTLKVSLVISVALFLIWMVAVGLLYLVLDGMGVWNRLNTSFTETFSESGSEGLINAGQVFGYSAVIGLVNVVLITALTTIGSFIYNQCTDLVGGIQVTLADPD